MKYNYNTEIFYHDANLEFIHRECVSWQKEVDFWMDEFVFFYKLLQETKKGKTISATDASLLQKELVNLQTVETDRLRTEIVTHERALAHLLKFNFSNDVEFRTNHARIADKLEGERVRVRAFKTRLFKTLMP